MENPQLQGLLSRLKSGTARQRAAASYQLSKLNDPSLVPAFIEAYDFPDNRVRRNITQALQQSNSEEARAFLRSPQYLEAVLNKPCPVCNTLNSQRSTKCAVCHCNLEPVQLRITGMGFGDGQYPIVVPDVCEHCGSTENLVDQEESGTGVLGKSVSYSVSRTLKWPVKICPRCLAMKKDLDAVPSTIDHQGSAVGCSVMLIPTVIALIAVKTAQEPAGWYYLIFVSIILGYLIARSRNNSHRRERLERLGRDFAAQGAAYEPVSIRPDDLSADAIITVYNRAYASAVVAANPGKLRPYLG